MRVFQPSPPGLVTGRSAGWTLQSSLLLWPSARLFWFGLYWVQSDGRLCCSPSHLCCSNFPGCLSSRLCCLGRHANFAPWINLLSQLPRSKCRLCRFAVVWSHSGPQVVSAAVTFLSSLLRGCFGRPVVCAALPVPYSQLCCFCPQVKSALALQLTNAAMAPQSSLLLWPSSRLCCYGPPIVSAI